MLIRITTKEELIENIEKETHPYMVLLNDFIKQSEWLKSEAGKNLPEGTLLTSYKAEIEAKDLPDVEAQTDIANFQEFFKEEEIINFISSKIIEGLGLFLEQGLLEELFFKVSEAKNLLLKYFKIEIKKDLYIQNIVE